MWLGLVVVGLFRYINFALSFVLTDETERPGGWNHQLAIKPTISQPGCRWIQHYEIDHWRWNFWNGVCLEQVRLWLWNIVDCDSWLCILLDNYDNGQSIGILSQ